MSKKSVQNLTLSKKEVFNNKQKQHLTLWHNRCCLAGAKINTINKFTAKFAHNKMLLAYLEKNDCAFKWLLNQLAVRDANAVQPEILDLMKKNIQNFDINSPYNEIIRQNTRLFYPEEYAGDINSVQKYHAELKKLVQSFTDKKIGKTHLVIYQSYVEYIFSFTMPDELDKTVNDIKNLVDEIEYHQMQPSDILKSDIDARMPSEALDFVKQQFFLSKTHFKTEQLQKLAQKISTHVYKKEPFFITEGDKTYKIVEISSDSLSCDNDDSITGFGALGDEVQYEASMQQNCLFDLHLAQILSGQEKIYSIRSLDNLPLVTICISNGSVREVKSAQNSCPANAFYPVCVKLFASLNIKSVLCYDMNNLRYRADLQNRIKIKDPEYINSEILFKFKYGYIIKHNGLYGSVNYKGTVLIKPVFVKINHSTCGDVVGYKKDGSWCRFY